MFTMIFDDSPFAIKVDASTYFKEYNQHSWAYFVRIHNKATMIELCVHNLMDVAIFT